MSRHVALALAVALAGCNALEASAQHDDDDAVVASFSDIGQAAIKTLRANHATARGQTWDLAVDNTLAPDWVIQTPGAQYWGQPVATLPIASSCTGDAACDPDFGLLACASQADCRAGGTCVAVAATVARPGDPPRHLCAGHSDAIYDRIYTLVTGAQLSVEITSLGAPDGRFEAALRDAITYLSRSGRAVRVRYVWGAIVGADLAGPSTDDVLHALVRDVDPASAVRVAVGAVRDGPVSWNHAKIVAVDGESAIVGGHNLWTQHYLQAAPVHDLSMEISGSAALQATMFSDTIWRRACAGLADLGSSTSISGFPDRGAACDEPLDLAPAPGAGSTRVITVGRLGAFGDDASDDALVAVIDAAHVQLRISQQDLGPLGAGSAWPERTMRALLSALARGVDVEFVMTNLNALPGGLTGGSSAYSNGWTASDVVQALASYAAANPDALPAGVDARALLCSKLHATSLRPSADDAWPGGASFANHAKLVIVDDRAFYLGSQNLYPANLFELGYIVDDPAATGELVDAYYAPLWQQSKRVAVSGADATSCVL